MAPVEEGVLWMGGLSSYMTAKFLQVLSSLHILLYIEFNYRTPSSLSVRMRW